MTSAVNVYSTPTCPDCRALKAWLGRSGIAYAERDLTDLAVMDEAKCESARNIDPLREGIGVQF
jgi:glutaredoxin